MIITSIRTQNPESRSFFRLSSRQTPSEAFQSTPPSPSPSPSHPARTPASQSKPPRLTRSAPFPVSCSHLYSFICEGQTHLEDPTGTLETALTGEQAAQTLLNHLRKNHPQWSEVTLQEKLAETIFNPTQRQRLQKAFLWVKRELLHFFDQQSDTLFSAAEKMRIKTFLMETTLQIPPPAQIYGDHSELLMSDDVFYEKTEEGQRFLKIGGGYVLVYQSWFNLIFTLAHELAHSIDICEIKDEGLSFPAFDRLNACFLEQQLIALTPQRQECVSHDHLAEVFADWIAVQITSRALQIFKQEHPALSLENAVKNSVRDLCFQNHHGLRGEPEEETPRERTELREKESADSKEGSEFHPSPQVRIEKLFAQHPLIRELLGCPPPPPETQSSFCTWNMPSSPVPTPSHSPSSPRASQNSP